MPSFGSAGVKASVCWTFSSTRIRRRGHLHSNPVSIGIYSGDRGAEDSDAVIVECQFGSSGIPFRGRGGVGGGSAS
jgi:hypothetical protein